METSRITFAHTNIAIDIEEVGVNRYRVWVKPHDEDVFISEGYGTAAEIGAFVKGFRAGATYWADAGEKIDAATQA